MEQKHFSRGDSRGRGHHWAENACRKLVVALALATSGSKNHVTRNQQHNLRSFGYGSTENREFSSENRPSTRPSGAACRTSRKALRGASVGVRRVRALTIPSQEACRTKGE